MNRWVQVYGTGKNIRTIAAYMISVGLVGFGPVLYVATKGGALPDPLTTGVYLVLTILGQHFSVTFPDINSIVLADPVIYAALWAFGPRLAIICQVAAIITHLLTQKKAILNTFFNASQFSLSIMVSSVWVHVAKNTPLGHNPYFQIVLVNLLILTFELMNNTFVSIAVALDQEQRWREVFPRLFFISRRKTFLLSYLINTAGVLLASYMGLAGISFVFAAVFVLWLQLRFEQELAVKSLEANTDALTGLLNARYLESWLENDFAKLSAGENTCSIIFIDVDGLKGVNDQMGHDVGDLLLQHLAKVLKSVVRSCDSVIRYGGDEFIVICAKTDLEQAKGIADRILTALRETPLVKDGTTVSFGISVGLASFPKHSTLGRDLVRLADKAMYLAKKDGGNRYRTADNL
ncbi:MAG TPA: GGDEF domain-containing protein [Firmicutes bacterium]|nr:GGDEF domain-containing protein [Candidatus Fermentithermobacillaceae bacterium]